MFVGRDAVIVPERDQRRVVEQGDGHRTVDALAAGSTGQRGVGWSLLAPDGIDRRRRLAAAVGTRAFAQQPDTAAVESVDGGQQLLGSVVAREPARREGEPADVPVTVRTADRDDVVGGRCPEVSLAQGVRLGDGHRLAVHPLGVDPGRERANDPAAGVGEPVARLPVVAVDLLEVVVSQLAEVVGEAGSGRLVGRLEQLRERQRHRALPLAGSVGECRERRHPGRRAQQREGVGRIGVYAPDTAERELRATGRSGTDSGNPSRQDVTSRSFDRSRKHGGVK